MSVFFGADGMGGNVERHTGDDDRDGAAIEAMRDMTMTHAHVMPPGSLPLWIKG